MPPFLYPASPGRPEKMTPILQHLVEITGHRDQDRLEVSVVSAMRHLVNIRRVRKLELVNAAEGRLIRPVLLLDDGQPVTADRRSPSFNDLESFSDFPELDQAIEHRLNSAERREDGSYLLWLPVRLQDKVVSVLELCNDVPYNPQALDVVYGIAEVYRNYQSLLDYSERDALTGLLNRKTFDEQFSRYSQTEVQSRGTQTADHASPPEQHWLGVVDIDHFKLVNDRFGHLYGDEVLILVTNLLRSSFRTHDRIFRFGGEEFVVLLGAVTLEDAHRIFNRFRTNIAQHMFPQVGSVTVTVGFTGTAGCSSVEVLGHADQALYYGKQHGRDQVQHYESLVASGKLESSTLAKNDVELF